MKEVNEKKQKKLIIVGIIAAIVIVGGVVFGILWKNDVFKKEKPETKLTEKDESNVEKDNDNDNQDTEENEKIENPANEETNQEENTSKEETPKKEETVPKKPSTNKVTSGANNVTNNKNQSTTKPSSSNNNNSNQNTTTPSKNEEPPTQPVTPQPPTETLEFSKTIGDKDGVYEERIVGVFDTSDHYIRKFTVTYKYDFTGTYEPFTDEERIELEATFKEDLVSSLEDMAGVFTITSSSHDNVFNYSLVTDYTRLKSYDPEGFTPEGGYYYDNFKAIYIRLGYQYLF